MYIPTRRYSSYSNYFTPPLSISGNPRKLKSVLLDLAGLYRLVGGGFTNLGRHEDPTWHLVLCDAGIPHKLPPDGQRRN